MMRPVNRVQPVGPSAAYRTYQVVAPVSTHFRPATCDEVDCPNQANGWRTVIDESTDLGKQQAYYVRNQSGRRYTETREAALTTFVFEAGQQCFRAHQTRLDRPDIYIVKDGDWRQSQNPRRHANGADWVDDFKNHQDQLTTRLERG